EVILKDPAQYARCQAKIEKIAGKNYVVQNKYQQEELLFKTMKSEKLIIYIILAFILLVATFNIIGTLGMLIIEKRPDIAILNSLGANRTLIQQIFVIEGLMISFLGGITGMLIGFIVCFIQQTFHVIKLGGGEAGYIIPYYPVEMHFSDFAVVLFTILVISLLTSWLPTRNIKKIAVK
ncbi:MAG: FtsX-like permease family protein, partial [Bacteroidales bacterium]